MLNYFALLFVFTLLLLIGKFTREKGFENLIIRRDIDKKAIVEGEEFKVTIAVENNKWMPVSFMIVNEELPNHLDWDYSDPAFIKGSSLIHTGRYHVLWYERIKRSYALKAEKRGVYFLKSIGITVGDLFGFSSKTKEVDDRIDLIVYPKLIDVKHSLFQSTNLQGDYIVRRWIHQDALYIKGIREYNVEDRMKDIHWKSSLKMNKLMVKDYDYTSEREIVLIVNVQCGEPYWGSVDERVIENGVRVAASLAAKALKEGIPTGLWTNAQTIAYKEKYAAQVNPSLNTLKAVMELCARIDYSVRHEFYQYLNDKSKRTFHKNCTYIIVTPFVNKDTVDLLSRLRKAGIFIKLIDVSAKGSIPPIEGIEKIVYKEERSHE